VISAREALQLDKAKITKQHEDEVRAVFKSIEEHIRATMVFPAPPTPLTIPFKHMSPGAFEIVCAIALQRFQWNITGQLAMEASRFQGGQPMPTAWILMMKPTLDVFKELLVNFDLEERPQLM
jgi:hypothetical protein